MSKGSGLFWNGIELTRENVNNLPHTSVIPMGWYVFFNLNENDVHAAACLVSLGLKPIYENGQISYPIALLRTPRLLRVFLDGGYDFSGVLTSNNLLHHMDESYEPGIRLLFERGAPFPPISAFARLPRTEVTFQRIYYSVCWRRNRCRRAAFSVCVIQRIQRHHRDVLGLIAKHIWETRYDDGWGGELSDSDIWDLSI